MSGKTDHTFGFYLLLCVLIAAGYTHIIHCLNSENYLLLIAGAIGTPIAVLHGLGLWVGYF